MFHLRKLRNRYTQQRVDTPTTCTRRRDASLTDSLADADAAAAGYECANPPNPEYRAGLRKLSLKPPTVS